MRLKQATQKLGWPTPEDILAPTGAGPAVYAEKADAKIATPFERKFPDISFQLGVVHRDPYGPSSEAPLAIACDFKTTASPEALRELHRLCWNFCHAPILVVFEPGQIRVWDCGTKPLQTKPNDLLDAAKPPEPLITTPTGTQKQEDEALRLLNWVSFATGAFFRETLPPEKFRDVGRADRSLLDNLKEVRSQLRQKGLSSDTCHDLLARIIFVQFLFDRKDTKGVSALNANILKRWHSEGSLNNAHDDLESILHSKTDTYRLFHKLDILFNGDLFPGKDPDSEISPEQAWQEEMEQVEQKHLDLLASLVSGKADTRTGQFWLWREYAFDTIPLEFISSIYEEFVVRDEEEAKASTKAKTPPKSKKGVVFTPGLLADFVLDQVLPWKGEEWDLSVLDPSCGSGIFLVKAFQRLVHRWRQAHPEQRPTPSVLRKLLEKNIVGVDINPHAIRVASFSLYLAMMDELDPRDYLKRNQVRLPSLRKRRILCSDLFNFASWQQSLGNLAAKFDIIVGNAPWGKKTVTETARTWASDNKWRISNNDIGPLFLPSCETLLKPKGRLSMLQPAMTLLFNRSSPTADFRERFFASYKVEQVVNFSPVRFILFGGQSKAVSPACLIVLNQGVIFPEDPDCIERFIQFATVKPRNTSEDNCSLSIDAFDIHSIRQTEAVNDPTIWTCLSWGGRRDFNLLKQLSAYDNLKSLADTGVLRTSDGIKWKSEDPKPHKWLLGRRRFQSYDLNSEMLTVDAASLVQNEEITAGRARKPENFAAPQVLVRKSWTQDVARILAIKVFPEFPGEGVLCDNRFVSLTETSQESNGTTDRAWVVLNSKLSVYYHQLTSGRLSASRPELLVEDILTTPIPDKLKLLDPEHLQAETCDTMVRKAFDLSDTEWTLVEDLFGYTLPDFKQGADSPGRQALTRNTKPTLRAYSEYFTRVIQGTFGKDKRVSCTVWQEVDAKQKLGFRLISLTLDPPKGDAAFKIHRDKNGILLDRVSAVMRDQKARYGSIPILPTMRFYSTVKHGNKSYPTIWIIKPDQMRYWTRSMGMRDADEVVADIMYAENPFDETT